MPSVLPSDSSEFEQSLRHLNRLASIGTLSTGLAHEIKNALVPLRTYFEFARQKNALDDFGQVAERELRRIESLVTQMLRYGRPAKPSAATVHLHEVLENALHLVQYQVANKLITLERAFAAPDLVNGDAYQLQQAFANVLINAVEAMSAGGKLGVATEVAQSETRNGKFVRVRISDTGQGIAPEDLGRLFDTFFTTKPNGTGLGLTITRRIIQEHGGTIAAESEPKKGTTFTILLPASA